MSSLDRDRGLASFEAPLRGAPHDGLVRYAADRSWTPANLRHAEVRAGMKASLEACNNAPRHRLKRSRNHAYPQRPARRMGSGELLPSLDAPCPARPRRGAQPHRHRRRGGLHRRPRRQEEPRRLRRALLRQCRLRPARDRRRHRRAGEEARLLSRLCRPRLGGLDHPGPHDRRARPGASQPHLFRPRPAPTPTRPTSSSSGTTTTSSAGRRRRRSSRAGAAITAPA